MAEGQVSSRGDALKALSEQKMPRDFYLNLQDIANIGRAEEKDTWRLAENPQESVLLWAAQNSEKILYIHEQQPLQGTRDYDLVASMRQQAAQRAGMRSCSAKPGQPEKSAGLSSSEVEDCLVEPAFTGADDLDGTGSGAAGAGSDRDCGDTVMPPRQLPKLESLDASCFNAANWIHFSVAVMDEHGVEAAIRFGHDRSLQLDSTFGCNAQKFPLYTLLTVDSHNKGIPIAYLISSAERVELVREFLESVQAKVILLP